MEVRRHLLPLLVLAVAGCSVGEYGAEQQSMTPDATQMSSGGAEASFNTNVAPLIATCTGCHGAQPPTLTSFSALQPKYKSKATAGILATKGDHQGITYFNATDKAKVQIYIDSLP